MASAVATPKRGRVESTVKDDGEIEEAEGDGSGSSNALARKALDDLLGLDVATEIALDVAAKVAKVVMMALVPSREG